MATVPGEERNSITGGEECQYSIDSCLIIFYCDDDEMFQRSNVTDSIESLTDDRLVCPIISSAKIFETYRIDDSVASSLLMVHGDCDEWTRPYAFDLYNDENFVKYLTITSCEDNFHDASEEVAYDTSESDIHETAYLDPEHRAKLEEEWRQELAITEEDITSLRTVLAEKVKRAQDLKRKLGITVWREFKDDMEQGIKNVKESHAYKGVSEKMSRWNTSIHESPLYHKTGVALKTAGEKTTGAFTTLGTTVSKKIGDVKNSTTFKSFEERVGSAYENVKSKVSTSRSSSTHSFEEALNDTSSTGPSPKTTTPTIVEEKPIS